MKVILDEGTWKIEIKQSVDNQVPAEWFDEHIWLIQAIQKNCVYQPPYLLNQ